MAKSFKVGICQMRVTEYKKQNIDKALEMVAEAAHQGCQMVVLPEMFNCPYVTVNFPAYAEPVPNGETTFALQEAAERGKIIIVGGSIPEKTNDGQIFNTSIAINRQGEIIAKHRKIHLFDVDISDGITFRESDTLSPGKNVTTFDTEFGRIGLAVCYDLRFPELARLMVLEGAKVLIFPAAFNTTTGPAHWETLLRCRAIDNQVYVLAAAPAHHAGSAYPAYGHSMVVNPWGTIVTQAEFREELLTAEINLDMIEKIREELPLLKHRRTDVYDLMKVL